MHYVVILVGAIGMGIYVDAAKNKIGKVLAEVSGPPNWSARMWGIMSFLVVPIALYIIKRKDLLARAQEHPVEDSGRTATIIIIAGVMGFLVFVFSLGGTGGNVGLVKGGILDNNQSTTVGEALDNYRYFRSCRWESNKMANGIEVVNAIGVLILDEKEQRQVLQKEGLKDLEAVFQFTINRDGETFEYSFFGQRVVLEDGSTKDLNEWLQKYAGKEIFGKLAFETAAPDMVGALEKIYSNEPFQARFQ